MESKVAPLCLQLAITLGIISLLNAIGITFLIPVLVRFRYVDQDVVDDAKRLETEIQMTSSARVDTVGGKV